MSTKKIPAPPAGCLWLPEAAARIGVSHRTLYTWRQLDKGPASFKYIGRVCYRETALDAHLAECEAADRHSNPALSPLNRAPEMDIAIPERRSRPSRRKVAA